MGFNKRYIGNDQVKEIYQNSGIEGVQGHYTIGADALVLETGLASEIDDILTLSCGITISDKWNTISEMIKEEIKKGVDEIV
jgi:hypothetical protein|tara:strand:+ start:670 stop:915 length:246 start_codon:yes stop_codon:yes gene_type:complete